MRWDILMDDLTTVIATVPYWLSLGDKEKPFSIIAQVDGSVTNLLVPISIMMSPVAVRHECAVRATWDSTVPLSESTSGPQG